MTTELNVGSSLPEGLSRSLREALQQDLSASKRILRMVLDAAKERVSCQAAVILTPADDHNLCFFAATDDRFLTEAIPLVPIDSSIAGFVYLSGQAIALDSARKSSMYFAAIDERTGFVTAEYLAVPIIHEGETTGVFTAANRSGAGDQGPFTQSEIDLAGQFADLAALLLTYESGLEQQVSEASGQIQQLFSEPGAGPTLGRVSAMSGERRTNQLRARLNLVLRDLPLADLELLHDLAARLGETSAADNA
jgi:GAF domain-containing protein